MIASLAFRELGRTKASNEFMEIGENTMGWVPSINPRNQVEASGFDLADDSAHMIIWRVPPAPRLWGPGMALRPELRLLAGGRCPTTPKAGCPGPVRRDEKPKNPLADCGLYPPPGAQ